MVVSLLLCQEENGVSSKVNDQGNPSSKMKELKTNSCRFHFVPKSGVQGRRAGVEGRTVTGWEHKAIKSPMACLLLTKDTNTRGCYEELEWQAESLWMVCDVMS